MAARWGAPAETLAPGHPAWALEAEYLALACANWTLTLALQKIVLGGGVMQTHLFPLIRRRASELLNSYVDSPDIVPTPESCVR